MRGRILRKPNEAGRIWGFDTGTPEFDVEELLSRASSPPSLRRQEPVRFSSKASHLSLLRSVHRIPSYISTCSDIQGNSD